MSPAYRGASRAIKVSDCVEVTAAPSGPTTPGPAYRGASRAIKTLQNVQATPAPTGPTTPGPAYRGASRAIKVLLPCEVEGCTCMVETFSRVETDKLGLSELGPVGWTLIGGTVSPIDDVFLTDPNFSVDGTKAIIGDTDSLTGAYQMLWMPEVDIAAPFEYAVKFKFNEAAGFQNQEWDWISGNAVNVIENEYHYIIPYYTDTLAGYVGIPVLSFDVWVSNTPANGGGSTYHSGTSGGDLPNPLIVNYDVGRWTWVRVRLEPSRVSLKAWYDGDPEPNWQIVLNAGAYIGEWYIQSLSQWILDVWNVEFDMMSVTLLRGEVIDNFNGLLEYGDDGVVWPATRHGDLWENVSGPADGGSQVWEDFGFGGVFVEAGDQVTQKITPTVTDVELNSSDGWELGFAFFVYEETGKFSMWGADGATDLISFEDGTFEVTAGGATGVMPYNGAYWGEPINVRWQYVPGAYNRIKIWQEHLIEPRDWTAELVDPLLPTFGTTLFVKVEDLGGSSSVDFTSLNFLFVKCVPLLMSETFSRDVAPGGWGDSEFDGSPWVGFGPGQAGLSVGDGVGKNDAAGANRWVEWQPGPIEILKPPFEYGYDFKGFLDWELDLHTFAGGADNYHYFVPQIDVNGFHFSVIWASGPPFFGFTSGTSAPLIPPTFDANRWASVRIRVEESSVAVKAWYRDEDEPRNWGWLGVGGGSSSYSGGKYIMEQFEKWIVFTEFGAYVEMDNLYFRKLTGAAIEPVVVEQEFDPDITSWPGWESVEAVGAPEVWSSTDSSWVYIEGEGSSIQKLTPGSASVDLNAARGWTLTTAFSPDSGDLTTDNLMVRLYSPTSSAEFFFNGDGTITTGTESIDIGTIALGDVHHLIWEYVPGVRSTIYFWDANPYDVLPPQTPTVEWLDTDIPLFGDTIYLEVINNSVDEWAQVEFSMMNILMMECP